MFKPIEQYKTWINSKIVVLKILEITGENDVVNWGIKYQCHSQGMIKSFFLVGWLMIERYIYVTVFMFSRNDKQLKNMSFYIVYLSVRISVKELNQMSFVGQDVAVILIYYIRIRNHEKQMSISSCCIHHFLVFLLSVSCIFHCLPVPSQHQRWDARKMRTFQ